MLMRARSKPAGFHRRTVAIRFLLSSCSVVDSLTIRKWKCKCWDIAIHSACADLSMTIRACCAIEFIKIMASLLPGHGIEMIGDIASAVLVWVGSLVFQGLNEHVEAGGEERAEDWADPINPRFCEMILKARRRKQAYQ
jgi:hypothetical protein